MHLNDQVYRKNNRFLKLENIRENGINPGITQPYVYQWSGGCIDNTLTVIQRLP